MRTVTRLSQFGFLAVNGKDAKTFMQGYTTCDVNKLTDTEHLGAICNLQGRMVTNFRIAETDEGLLLRMHLSLVPGTMAFLAKYIVFSKAELVDVSDQWHCYGVIGQAEDVQPGQIRLQIASDRFEVWSQAEITDADDAASAWEQRDCDEGFAWIDSVTTEQYLPQMYNLHNLHGIDFEKGCYLGQEIIARAQYRGQLKRKLHRGESSADLAEVLEIGVALANDDGTALGDIIATAGSTALAVVQNSESDSLVLHAPGGESVKLSPVDP